MISNIKKIRKPASLAYKKITSFSNKIIRLILKKLPYAEVSRLRSVSQKFNEIGRAILNSGLDRIYRENQDALKVVKRTIPRSKAAKDIYLRTGLLAGHFIILEALETIIIIMKTSYRYSIDKKKSCFVPGIILDEIRNVLRKVNSTENTLNPDDELEKLCILFNLYQEYYEKRISKNFWSNRIPVPVVILERQISLDERLHYLKRKIGKNNSLYIICKSIKKASFKIQRKTVKTFVKIDGYKEKIRILKEEIYNSCVQNTFQLKHISQLKRNNHNMEDIITSSIITQASVEAGEDQVGQAISYSNEKLACIRCQTAFKKKPPTTVKIVFKHMFVDANEHESGNALNETEISSGQEDFELKPATNNQKHYTQEIQSK